MLTQVLEIEEKTIISSLLGSSLCPHIPEVETKKRRRRKKARAETASGKAKKRRLSDEQAKFLEMNFGKERKLESRRKVLLATELGLDPEQVAVWFQNRRARWKNKQIEEEYTKLKAKHDTVVVEKCHLENEVLKLRERLMEAEEEIKKLSKSLNGASEMGGSPRSSFSTATQHHLLGGFGLEEDTDMLYVNEYNSYMEWVNFYGM